MADLVVSAPAKINLHLEVLGLRPDGFHELAMLMQSVDLCDRLVLTPTADAAISLDCDRADLPTDGSNLIVRAAELLRSRSGLPELGVHLQLQKRIPIGAGLAGGSSNAAAALVGLNALWGLGLQPVALSELAAELGSDVPFCLEGGARLCFGRGERLEPLAAPPTELGVLLVKHPAASVSTPWAYGRCRELRRAAYLELEEEFEQRRQALRQGALIAALRSQSSWPLLRNDLQAVVEPEIAAVRQGLTLLRQAPDALAVAMSGSGPTCFALFSSRDGAAAAAALLAPPLAELGIGSWVCSTLATGVRLEP